MDAEQYFLYVILDVLLVELKLALVLLFMDWCVHFRLDRRIVLKIKSAFDASERSSQFAL